jgi:ParB-like chromosome segregation protein Spo0J
VVDKHGVIVAGHTRLAAAKQLGLEHVPVHLAGDLTPEQIRGYRLMDNRSNEETSWDSAVLSMEMGELKGLGFDIGHDGIHHRRAE